MVDSMMSNQGLLKIIHNATYNTVVAEHGTSASGVTPPIKKPRPLYPEKPPPVKHTPYPLIGDDEGFVNYIECCCGTSMHSAIARIINK